MCKRFSKKSLLLFTATAVSALSGPSIASASSWGVIGTTHVLDSSNLSWTMSSAIGSLGASCAESHFDTDVTSAARLTITSGAMNRCVGTGLGVGCTATVFITKFPWSVTGPAPDRIEIHSPHMDVVYETEPPNSCALDGIEFTVTGTIGFNTATATASWDAAAHQMTFNNTAGLTSHSAALGSSPTTFSGTLRDTAQTLTLT